MKNIKSNFNIYYKYILYCYLCKMFKYYIFTICDKMVISCGQECYINVFDEGKINCKA